MLLGVYVQHTKEARMNTHKNARLTPFGRRVLVERILVQGMSVKDAADASAVSTRTAYKWLARFRHGGLPALADASSRPAACPHQSSAATVRRIVSLRRRRWPMREIAVRCAVSPSTVSRILKRAGLSRLRDLEPAAPSRRYEHAHPGDLLHLDIKKLGRFNTPGHRVTGDRQQGTSRGAGWEYAHVAIDDHARVAHMTLWPDETGRSACKAVLQALRYYRGLGVRIKRLLTDNGSCYCSKRFARMCRRLGLVHSRTRAYRPQTNGKAERFIQTALREWAYARSYENSDQRARALPHWLHRYNWHRPHASLGYQQPITRLGIDVNNLLTIRS